MNCDEFNNRFLKSDLFQCEAFRESGISGKRTVPRSNNDRNLLRGSSPGADIDQCSGYDPDHIVKKAVSADSVCDEVSVPHHFGAVNRTDRGFPGKAGTAESSEVMSANEEPRGFIHFAAVERIVVMKGI